MAKLYVDVSFIQWKMPPALKSWPVSLNSSCKGLILWHRFTFKVEDVGGAVAKSQDFRKTKLIEQITAPVHI